MKRGIFLIGLTIAIFIQPFNLFGQGKSVRGVKPEAKEAGEPIICYFTDKDMFTIVPLRESLAKLKSGRQAGAQGATFEVRYFGFNSGQQAAFQYAVDIWAGLLNSPIPIRIDVAMSTDMPSGTLASTGWGGLYTNYGNMQNRNTWYVASLAEKIQGEELNDATDPDIVMNFNVEQIFYTGLDQQTPSGQFDMVTIALHEIGHGLGFYTHTNVANNQGSFGAGVGGNPTVYAVRMENGDGENLYESYESGTTQLGTQLTGDDLFFNSFSFPGTNLPQLYAPSEWNGGSSISHLDETKYTSGTINSLMTPQVGFAESVHDPGISLKMLEDMGWISMKIDHNALLDTEDRSSVNTVVAVITGDNSLKADGANLHYTFTNWTQGVVVPMTATGNADEYVAEIPATVTDAIVSYYIEIEDNESRFYTSPGDAPDFFNQFVVANDTIAPELFHQPLNFVFTANPVANIFARVIDNLGTTPLIMNYKINGGTLQQLEIPVVALNTDGYYVAEHLLEWDLAALNIKKGDIIEYNLSISDLGANANKAIHPAEDIGFNIIQIDDLKPSVEFYTEDFNAPTDDFIGSGFSITTEAGFDDGAIHSDHPYRLTPGISSEDTVILQYLLKTQIKLAANNALIKFDEVVLIEPGEPGTVFGDNQFWDYVIVEGSSDLGVTWVAFEPGYDSGDDNAWLTHYNSDLVSVPLDDFTYTDSRAVGNKTFFRPRTINMANTDQFDPGEELLIRFKIYADQLATGWGWAVDNLKIQYDNEAPVISHIAKDYLNIGDTEFNILTKVTDNAVLDSVIFEVIVDGQSSIIGADNEVDIYDLNISTSPVTATTEIKYRIIAVDSAAIPNTSYLPQTGYFEIPVAILGDVKTSYSNDFNAASSDFIGANYSIAQPQNFNDGAIHSLHPHSNSPSGTSTMSYLLKYPIKLNSGTAWLAFNEIGLVDNFGDGLTVEVSKDLGATWHQAVDLYNAYARPSWSEIFFQKDENGNSTAEGSAGLYEYRLVNLLSPAEINAGDDVLIRFTMEVNDQYKGWGWSIDDIDIQGPTTAIELTESSRLNIYPNPASDGRFRVVGDIFGKEARILVTNMLGKVVYDDEVIINNNFLDRTLDVSSLKHGVYLVSIQGDSGAQSIRVLID